ncbi:MAG: hypothetical protein NT004_15270 [Bacteroidetes bacterium]|nr:hypothetical protein [Bacteroidota bacterium]
MKTDKNFSSNFLAVAFFAGFLLLLSGCKKEEPAPVQPGVTWQYIETYDLQKLNHIFNIGRWI